MRILFVSGVVDGGSWRSTRELAAALAGRGHDVRCLVRAGGSDRTYYVYRRAVNLRTKLGESSPLGRAVGLTTSRIGAATVQSPDSALVVYAAPVIENALPAVLDTFPAHAIVASSVERIAWRAIRSAVHRRGAAAVLYLREASAIGHLTISNAAPDLLLANAQALTDLAAGAGFHAQTAPSIVDLDMSRTNTSRRVALLINPIESHGVDLVLDMAGMNPEMSFVLQESWPLSTAQAAQLRTRIETLPNVALRRSTSSPAQVYRDTRMLMAPYREDQRPRVILEALANGIPVLVSAQPGLIDAARGAGVVVVGDDVESWNAALRRVWVEPEYSNLVGTSLEVGDRAADEMRVAVETVEKALTDVVRLVSSDAAGRN